MKLEVPLKEQASPEVKHQIGLRAMRKDFGRQVAEQREEMLAVVGGLQRRLDLMALQMNQRVFFGVNHSVHVKCTKLGMGAAPGCAPRAGAPPVGAIAIVAKTGGLIEADV